LHTICFFRQDDGDAGDDDVSSDDNTDILSSCDAGDDDVSSDDNTDILSSL
jgi:hypothetical protein